MPATALLERQEQLDSLRARLSDAASGRGAMVLVGGEAGIGKSALVQRFCEEVGDGSRVLIGSCDAMQTPRPLGPLVDMAAAFGPPLTRLLDGGGARERVFGLLLDAFRERPTVAVFEDVHWADDATLDLLRFLGRRIGGTRTLVIATYRRDEVGPRHPLRTVLGDLATAPAVSRMGVPPLTREAVARLAQGTDVDVDELHRLAEAAIARAVDALEGLPSGHALVRAYQFRASLRMLDRDLDAAIAWGVRTIELATELGEPQVVASAHVTVAPARLAEAAREGRAIRAAVAQRSPPGFPATTNSPPRGRCRPRRSRSRRRPTSCTP